MLAKYNSGETATVGFRRISRNVVELSGSVADASGFQVYRDDGVHLGDYSEYTTVYREIHENNGDLITVQYSDDGSVWAKPEDAPSLDGDTPTQEERITALEAQLAAYEAAYTQGVNEA